MKRIVSFCSLFILIFVNVLYVHAENFEIPLDDSYVEGVIAPLETEKMSAEENEIQVYSFQLEEPGKIDLHFISHVNNMRFQIKDIDENIIEDDYIRSEYSPKDYKLTLDAGTYTLHIIKIAPTGLMRVRVSDDNIGDYKFKMKYASIINQENNADGQISYGKTYEGFFQSRNNSDTVEKNLGLQVTQNGTYMFQISSDMTLNYLIRDADENVIGEGTSYADSNSTQELALTSGVFDIVCSTSEAGSYQIYVEPKEIEGSDQIHVDPQEIEGSDEGDEASPQKDTGKNGESDVEKSNIIEKLGSVIANDFIPSTVGGQIAIEIIVTVVGGLILYLFTKK